MPAKAGIHRPEATGILNNHFAMDTGSKAGMTRVGILNGLLQLKN
jgi:hypothetical protein